MSVSFGRQVLPTKIELIRVKRSLQVAKAVHKILEDKREVLLRRLEELMQNATEARSSLWQPLSEAYSALFDAHMAMGPMKLESIASTTPSRMQVGISAKMIVGVKVSTLTFSGETVGLTYGFADTSSSLDRAAQMMRRALPAIIRAAEVENAIFGLARELERTQRLLNALEYIIIPSYEESVKFIRSTLEEREREDFARLKHVKAVMEKKRGGG